MKKLNLLTIFIMLAFVSVSFGQITGSAHDFSSADWNSTGEICITCHTPHNAIAGEEPLWNHTISTTTYTLYSSSTFDADNGTADYTDPDGSSKLCLSCHDGTVALDNFGGNGTVTTESITGDALMGNDLSNDHPVSFNYANVQSLDAGLVAIGSLPAEIKLENGKMQCSSCHDVHDAGIAKLLVKVNSASALCLSCHIK